LTFQVKGTSGRSDEAVSNFQYDFRPGGASYRGDGITLDSISLTESDYTFAIQVQLNSPCGPVGGLEISARSS
jgi:hypothetical protein